MQLAAFQPGIYLFMMDDALPAAWRMDQPVVIRRVLLCCSEKEAETVATWQWWSARGAEQRDHITLLYVLRGGVLPLPPNERASDDAPPWFPAAALPELAEYPARPRFVELSTNTLTPVGETIQDWLLACAPEQRPDIIITGQRVRIH